MNFMKRRMFLVLPVVSSLVACGGVEPELPADSEPGASEVGAPEMTPFRPLERVRELGPGEMEAADGTVSAQGNSTWQITNGGKCLRVSGTYAYYATCDKNDVAQLWSLPQHPATAGTDRLVYLAKSALNINGAGAFQYCLESPQMNGTDGYARMKPCNHTFNNGYQFWEMVKFTVWNSEFQFHEWFYLWVNNYSGDMMHQKSSTDSYAWCSAPVWNKAYGHGTPYAKVL